jgi:tRNA1Val (adenine37-N6)-methyltransferase
MTSVTRDSISLRGAGVVHVAQPARGFRFNLDSLLLADFCRIKPRDRVLELGAGTGIVSLLLAKKFPRARFTAIEAEPQACSLFRANIEDNALTGSIVPIERDLQDLGRAVTPASFDVIVANPPYTRSGSGMCSPSVLRQTARQDRSAPLTAWLDRKNLLKNKGRFVLVFTANRAAELISMLKEGKLEPKRLRFVHPSLDKPASLVLIEAMKSAGAGIDVLPPLVLYGPGKVLTDELREIYGQTPAE